MKVVCDCCGSAIPTDKTPDELVKELQDANPGHFLDPSMIVLLCNNCHQLETLRWMPVKGTA
jgi:hypothetical protein